MTVQELENLPSSLRLVVLESLGHSNAPNAVELLKSQIHNGDPITRQTALESLKRLSPHSVPCKERTKAPSLLAIRELGQSDDPSAVARLREMSEDPDEDTKKAAQEAWTVSIKRRHSTHISQPKSPPVGDPKLKISPSPVAKAVPLAPLVLPKEPWFKAHAGAIFTVFFLFGIPIGLGLNYLIPPLGFAVILLYSLMITFMGFGALADAFAGRSRTIEGRGYDDGDGDGGS